MSAKPELPKDFEELDEQIAQRRQRSLAAVDRISSVPLALFGQCTPEVEARLIDDATTLLECMCTHDAPPLEPYTADRVLVDNRVTPDEVLELLSLVPRVEAQGKPDLYDNIDNEALWILADLAISSSGRASERARATLVRELEELWQGDTLDLPELESLERSLAAAADANPCDLLQTLRATARQVLDRRVDRVS